jgi:glycosyltransferase involved in cell wall biosynthesis
MKSSLVSCIVPVFNGERYLADALDSILKQSYKPLEIIVADDGSMDARARWFSARHASPLFTQSTQPRVAQS